MGVLYLISKGSSARKDGSRLIIEKEGQLVDEKASLAVIRQQLSCMEDKETSLAMSKLVVDEKIRNQYRLLKSYTRTVNNLVLAKAIKGLQAERKKVSEATAADSLRGIEGGSAKCYFSGFGALLDNRIWHSRDGPDLRQTRLMLC